VEPAPAQPGDIVVTEILKNPDAVLDGEGEWFELYNPTDADIDMNGWVIEDYDADFHKLLSSEGIIVPANSLVVLGLNADPAMNGGVDVDYQYAGFQLSNTSDEIVLISGEVVIDEVVYDDVVFPNEVGKSLNLGAEFFDFEANDLAENWCSATEVFGSGDFGTPGSLNPICMDPVICGDGECVEGEENCQNCQEDCGGCCGNNVCDVVFGEDCATCQADCGKCCGNGDCEEALGENCSTCELDCGQCCGNSVCDEELGESCETCLEDCGVCPSDCGNGQIEPGEPCDDGNLEDGDGCSSQCLLEFDLNTAPGMLIITEIMKDPKMIGDLKGEWLEITNVSTTPVDLAGWKLKDEGTDLLLISVDGAPLVGPGEIVVLGNNADFSKNGGVVVDYEYSGFTLANSDDEVILVAPTGLTVDEVKYTNDEFPDKPGKSLSLEPTMYDHEANDVAFNWCDSPAMMGSGDFGSPGSVNPGCEAGAECGNGILEWGEECDDGNVVGCDGCDSQCTLEFPPICGNGVKETCEECDDGNLEEGDGCSPTCKNEVEGICGNGVVEPGEVCDDGCLLGTPNVCEEGLDDGDGCSYLCTNEGVCGNGIIEPGEQCDDGNNIDGDGCGAMCDWEFQDPYCGDGKVEGTEQCDDGCLAGYPGVCEPEIDDNDGCSWECIMEGIKLMDCGNGLLEPDHDEDCDDGNKVSGDGCDEWCKIEGTGCCFPMPCCCDGSHDEGEECDDGNKVDGDGCSSDCKEEGGPPMAIEGTIYYDAEPGANDTVWVLGYDEPVESPDSETKPKAVEIFDAVFPLEYVLPVSQGTYYLMAVYDINGDAGQGFGLEDYPTLYTKNGEMVGVQVLMDQTVSGIDFTILPPEACEGDNDCAEGEKCDGGLCVPDDGG